MWIDQRQRKESKHYNQRAPALEKQSLKQLTRFGISAISFGVSSSTPIISISQKYKRQLVIISHHLPFFPSHLIRVDIETSVVVQSIASRITS
ncbi:hypothetical protein EYC84_010380 [Monilinia fructicola]|uniref:Uncharacterized protein n=1 Tax=Monilinia fructicola TaxID=38448 RepID=A0A5M9JHT5_MONFR|nr:hypothetical protein EYC84_010380 [Monilinia fructicola]